MSQFIPLNTIIGNGKSYKVPIYQRDYSWKKGEEVEDLWNDILDIGNEGTHYMGYLVLLAESKPNDSYWIIDGQQRLITISLLALAVIKLLKEWEEAGIDKDLNKERRKEEIRRYIGNLDTSAEETTNGFLPILPKLTLNRNNDDFYKSYLMNSRAVNALSKQKPTIRLMQHAFNFFYEKLKEKFGNEKSGSKLTQYLEKTVGTGLVFTVIEVQSDLDAFKVFETLNARGVKLSPADLLKNYLFSQAALRGKIELDEAERRWSNIANTLGRKDITDFIRHYWNSKYKLTRNSTLFKAIKTEIVGADKSFRFLENIESQSEYYVGFDNPADELWSKDERKHLQTFQLLEIITCYPILMAYLSKLDRKDFYILLREIAVIALRYNISELNPNEAERVYSDSANQIYSGKITTVREVIQSLKSIYVKDNQFEATFSNAEINTKRKKEFVKYLLISIENQISNTEYNFEDASATIEHILPESPGSVWDNSFSPDIQDDYIYRLGNFTLLKAGINNKLDNETSFKTKLEKYKQSPYKLSSEYCLYDDFKPTTLQARQDKMAKIAKTVWKSAFISE